MSLFTNLPLVRCARCKMLLILRKIAKEMHHTQFLVEYRCTVWTLATLKRRGQRWIFHVFAMDEFHYTRHECILHPGPKFANEANFGFNGCWRLSQNGATVRSRAPLSPRKFPKQRPPRPSMTIPHHTMTNHLTSPWPHDTFFQS